MATRITQTQLDKFISPAAAMAPYERAQQDKTQRNSQDAALKQLITGKQVDENYRKDHVAESDQRIDQYREKYPDMAPTIDETGNIGLHPIDTLDKALKTKQMGVIEEDRQDRIKGRETNQLQNYYSSQGGKNYSQKAAVLARAKELFDKGDPESLRSAELELSQGQAANALTQQEYNALTSAHGAGNMMQTAAKNTANIVGNVVPKAFGGDKLANWLGKKAAEMKTMTPAEIQQKQEVAQHLIDQNRASADAIRAELQQRASQLAPSMARHDPRGLNTVIDTLGARIPGEDSHPMIPGRQTPPPQPVTGKQVVQVLRHKGTGQTKTIYSDGTEEIK